MRRLMLLRHAKTETDAASGRDQDRRLDDRGRIDAAEIGRFMGAHPPLPDLVLVSPAIRAHQTWEIVHEAIKETIKERTKDLDREPRVELLPELYAADISQLLRTIRTASTADPKVLMVVGHNPAMHELALALGGSGDDAGRKALAGNLPTSGLAVFEFAVDDWEDVAFRRGRLARFVSPKLLKQMLDD
ncbi:SixA phosphatase family protein [Bradyrhizobium sp.]|jgi:phosphohistidine phosphatase|uniref:SixA phosphatase family protein n=1 Tax=Bradyrhizobium sp. TaxID=376 RepID=UPI003C14F17D